MEAVLVVATIASRWRMRLAPGAQITTRPRVTLRPGKGGIPVVLEAR
jgi:hypothetical protein